MNKEIGRDCHESVAGQISVETKLFTGNKRQEPIYHRIVEYSFMTGQKGILEWALNPDNGTVGKYIGTSCNHDAIWGDTCRPYLLQSYRKLKPTTIQTEIGYIANAGPTRKNIASQHRFFFFLQRHSFGGASGDLMQWVISMNFSGPFVAVMTQVALYCQILPHVSSLNSCFQLLVYFNSIVILVGFLETNYLAHF